MRVTKWLPEPIADQLWRLRRRLTGLDRQTIGVALQSLGPCPGEVLLVHSSLATCGYVRGGPPTVIAALDNWLDGRTLAMPTHTYCYPHGDELPPVFDVAETASQNGVITNCFRRQPGVLRSLHPTHSLAARGPRNAALCAGHENCDTPCGAGTPYQRLVELDCSVLMFGVSMKSYTLFHTTEALARLPFKYEPLPYRLRLKQPDGTVRPFFMWRQITNMPNRYRAMADWLEPQGLLVRCRFGVGELLFIPHAKAVHERLLAELERDPMFLIADSQKDPSASTPTRTAC